ncbi:AAA family ATPase [Tersicoccus sp. MR15.9]|uniref:AAA family ATPase n=1 Tax=Tersicoccus mangrovi TaxID=3121635 RepID=UPI002FE5DA1F
MPTLLLLNGPPGVGKSTVADALVRSRPGWVAVSVDEVKHALPTWPAEPIRSGLAARDTAASRVAELLDRGQDVVVDQYLARQDFVIVLERVARDADARFLEVVLTVDEATVAQRLGRRRRRPTRAEQVENDRFVNPGDAAALLASLAARRAEPGVHRVDASGPVAQTLRVLDALLAP